MTPDAWAAGFFDGEGCVRISTSRSRGYRQYQLTLTVTQAGDPEVAPLVLTTLCDAYGGYVRREQAKGNRRTPWRWTVVSRQAEAFLRAVLPHLIGKREQAEVALRFREATSERGARGEVAERYRIELSLLKHGAERHAAREKERERSGRVAPLVPEHEGV